ncbi:uncharacterized protein BJX67DRAFT_281039 [Aspergillus lucknowensis]|uniref:Uncharacterized protein n=1 Tax=Aspergillus lucknowensis TaxID=176173 RepID=A0ABR4M0V9_9EURO
MRGCMHDVCGVGALLLFAIGIFSCGRVLESGAVNTISNNFLPAGIHQYQLWRSPALPSSIFYSMHTNMVERLTTRSQAGTTRAAYTLRCQFRTSRWTI